MCSDDTIFGMEDRIRAVTWDAPEHHFIEKGGDWFWVLGIVAVSGAVASFIFGNFLFAILILVGAAAMALQAAKPPRILNFMVATRGVRVGDRLYPYSSLQSYCIDEEDPHGPQLLLKSKHIHASLITMPLPDDSMDEIEELLRSRLQEEQLEEPVAHRILEIFGF